MINLVGKFVYRILFIIIFFSSLISCKESKSVDDDSNTKQKYFTPENLVEIQILEKQFFYEELLANGRLVARQKNVLKFEVGGSLEKLNTRNGDVVKKGFSLAVLKQFEYLQVLNQAETDLKKADLEFRDMLVGRGYDMDYKDSIPENIYEMAGLRSGYKEAQGKLKDAQYQLNSTTLRAPFSGKIANIGFKKYERITEGVEFLTLIDDTIFDVEFHLIESEINKVKLGQTVTINAFASGKSYIGTITSINPLVEEGGTILTKAQVVNDGQLIEGMNVKVQIKKKIPNQFIVPKSAVVLRENQEVLFKFQEGKTYWTYVNTVYENSTDYAIVPNSSNNSATLTDGDTIIISGNLNLNHDSRVTIKP